MRITPAIVASGAGATGSLSVEFLKSNDAATGAFSNLGVGAVGAVSDPSYRTFADLRAYTKVRFLGRIGGTLVAATKLRIQYSASSDPTIAIGDASWATLATSAGSHSLGVTFYTAEEAIPAEARLLPCQLRAVLFDGDGVADPTMSLLVANFYT